MSIRHHGERDWCTGDRRKDAGIHQMHPLEAGRSAERVGLQRSHPLDRRVRGCLRGDQNSRVTFDVRRIPTMTTTQTVTVRVEGDVIDQSVLSDDAWHTLA